MWEKGGGIQMSRRLITVFGGSGFIGRHLVQRLAHDGWTVRVAVRDPEAALYLTPLGKMAQIVPVAADVTKPELARAAVHGAQAVVNLVGILYERGRRSFQSIHVDGARIVAEAAAAEGVERLVHISALGADKDSESAYARSKALGEEAVKAAFPRATIIRPSVVFGPEDGFFNRFAQIARLSPVVPVITGKPFSLGKGGKPWAVDVFGGGGPKFQPVYVGDVAAAIMAALHDAAHAGRTYELGGPCVYSMKQVMELVMKYTDRRRLLVPLPTWVAAIEAVFLQFLPSPPLTPDQVRLLKRDNVLTGASGLEQLGIEPTAAEVILPTYLGRHQPIESRAIINQRTEERRKRR
jgi:uncharacterized protein YbjT (DUF2867 family)